LPYCCLVHGARQPTDAHPLQAMPTFVPKDLIGLLEDLDNTPPEFNFFIVNATRPNGEQGIFRNGMHADCLEMPRDFVDAQLQNMYQQLPVHVPRIMLPMMRFVDTGFLIASVHHEDMDPYPAHGHVYVPSADGGHGTINPDPRPYAPYCHEGHDPIGFNHQYRENGSLRSVDFSASPTHDFNADLAMKAVEMNQVMSTNATILKLPTVYRNFYSEEEDGRLIGWVMLNDPGEPARVKGAVGRVYAQLFHYNADGSRISVRSWLRVWHYCDEQNGHQEFCVQRLGLDGQPTLTVFNSGRTNHYAPTSNLEIQSLRMVTMPYGKTDAELNRQLPPSDANQGIICEHYEGEMGGCYITQRELRSGQIMWYNGPKFRTRKVATWLPDGTVLFWEGSDCKETVVAKGFKDRGGMLLPGAPMQQLTRAETNAVPLATKRERARASGPPPQRKVDEPKFRVNARVVIFGLTTRTDLNNKGGRVVELPDGDSGRFAVQLYDKSVPPVLVRTHNLVSQNAFEKHKRSGTVPDQNTDKAAGGISDQELARRAAYEANRAAEEQALKVVEEKRKQRAAESREHLSVLREGVAAACYFARAPQKRGSKSGVDRTAVRTEEEQVLHENYTSEEARAFRRAAGEAKQAVEHAEALARRLKDRADKLREVERNMGKAEAAATHVLPPRPSLDIAAMLANIEAEFE